MIRFLAKLLGLTHILARYAIKSDFLPLFKQLVWLNIQNITKPK